MSTSRISSTATKAVALENVALSKELSQNLALNNLFKLWYTTKNIVIIRPKFPNDNYTTLFSYPAAGQIKTKATAEGWTVTDLAINDANRAKVTSTINGKPVDFVVHYDHGGDFVMCGQNNNQFENAIDNLNVALLKSKAASTVSCETAIGLGPLAITSGARAYLGYSDLHWVYFAWTSQFTQAANAANNALLEGKTYQEAYNIAYNVYTTMYNQILAAGDVPAASAMLHNRNCLTLLGDPNAKAIGRHSLFELIVVKPLPA